jgi:hypothetical protein
MNQASEFNSDDRHIWADQDSRQRFEHDLINRQTTWWLTAQAILFAAYGITLRTDTGGGGADFRQVVSWSGFLSALVTLVGVLALIRSKYLSWREYAAFYAESQGRRLPQPFVGKPLPWGVKTSNTLVTLIPDVALPVIFGGGWLSLLVYSA